MNTDNDNVEFEGSDFATSRWDDPDHRKEMAEAFNKALKPKKPVFAWIATAVAVLALGLSGFALFKGGPEGPQGPIGNTGPKGDSPAATEVAEVLKNDNVFKAEIKGEQGPQGLEGKAADSSELTALKNRIAELEKSKAERDAAFTKAPKANPANQDILDSSKNWVGHGDQDIPDDLKKIIAAVKKWQTHDGWKFPILLNRHGNPSPLKGGGPPMFLKKGSSVGDWQIRSITLQNPRGAGSYTTQGWAYKG
jgi:hypothetical protein